MKPLAALALCAGVAVLAGCGHSPPTRFYTLDAVASQVAARPYAGPPLRIGQVLVPPVLDRNEVVQEITAGRLQVDDLDHWGAPLGQLIRTALESDLSARLPAGDFLPGTGAAPDDAGTVVVTVLGVSRTAEGLSMDVSWTLTRSVKAGPHAPPSRVTTTHGARLASDPVDASPQGYAAGLSQMVGRLADAVVAGG